MHPAGIGQDESAHHGVRAGIVANQATVDHLISILENKRSVRVVGSTGTTIGALELCPTVDVILVEAGLSETAGTDLARRIRRSCPRVGLLLLANVGEVPLHEAVDVTDGLLVTSVSAGRLTQAVISVARGEGRGGPCVLDGALRAALDSLRRGDARPR